MSPRTSLRLLVLAFVLLPFGVNAEEGAKAAQPAAPPVAPLPSPPSPPPSPREVSAEQPSAARTAEPGAKPEPQPVAQPAKPVAPPKAAIRPPVSPEKKKASAHAACTERGERIFVKRCQQGCQVDAKGDAERAKKCLALCGKQPEQQQFVKDCMAQAGYR